MGHLQACAWDFEAYVCLEQCVHDVIVIVLRLMLFLPRAEHICGWHWERRIASDSCFALFSSRGSSVTDTG